MFEISRPGVELGRYKPKSLVARCDATVSRQSALGTGACAAALHYDRAGERADGALA